MISMSNNQREVSKGGSKRLRAIFSALPTPSSVRSVSLQQLVYVTVIIIDGMLSYQDGSQSRERSYSGRGIPQGKQEMRLTVVASLSENCLSQVFKVLAR